MEKQLEVIRKAIDTYYNQYPLVKPYADCLGYFAISNGYVKNLNESVLRFYYSLGEVDYLKAEDHEEYNSHFRPKELSYLIKQIETNNGWFSIKEHGLPKSGNYKFLNRDNPKDDGENRYVFDELREDQFKSWFTHYKPIEKEILPLY
jgi:hypothetical protein